MRKLCSFTAALALLLIVAGCGGGGSDPVPPANTDCVIGTSTIGDCTI